MNNIAQAVELKAKDYYDLSRNKTGCPTKTLDQCRQEVLEDYPDPKILAKRNEERYQSFILHQARVVWADGTPDYNRTCNECLKPCANPVHAEQYREIYKARHDEDNNAE